MPSPRKPAVWSSTLTHTGRNIRSIGFDALRPVMDYVRDSRARRTVAYKDAPTRLYLTVKDLTEHEKCHFPDAIVIASRVIVVSPDFHDLLHQFDLGPTQFFEVPLYEYDQTTMRPERYFVMQVNAVKDAVVPEESTGIKPWDDKYLPLDSSQGEFAVTPAALEGPDLWWDKNIIERLFFSDRLKRAIKDNRIHASVWGWRKCRILD